MYYRRLEEIENGWKITIPAPGAKKEDVEVNLEDGLLTIDISRNEHMVGLHVEYIPPKGVKEDHIKAKLKDGLLAVTVEKPEGYSTKIKVQ